MQTLIDIPEADITLLDRLSKDRQISRDELVRTALSVYLDTQLARPVEEVRHKDAWDRAFGSWANFSEDGLAYQERLRREWER